MTKLPMLIRWLNTARPPQPQHHQERCPDQHFQQRLEQTLYGHQPEVLRDVLLIEVGEAAHFGLLLHEGAHHADAGKALLHAAGDVGEHGLDDFKAGVNQPAEEYHGQADGRRGKNAV